MRCLDQRFAVAGEIRRHVINNEPQDIGPRAWLRRIGCEQRGQRREQQGDDECEGECFMVGLLGWGFGDGAGVADFLGRFFFSPAGFRWPREAPSLG